MIFFSGDHGSGKSYSALTLAKALDPNFTVDNVVFTSEDFFKLSKEASPGDVIIFDEAGANLPPERWWDTMSLLLDKWLQVFRYRNLVVIFTAYGLEDILKKARKRFHYNIFIEGNNGRHAIGRWFIMRKYYAVGHGVRIQELYPRLYIDGTRYVVAKVYFASPPPDLVRAYEEKRKAEVGAKFERRIELEISQIVKAQHEMSEKEIIQEVLADPERFTTKQGRISVELIQAEFNVGYNRARRIKTFVERELGII